jgi:FkbM family methyltransferase
MNVKRKEIEFVVSDNPDYQSFWGIDRWGWTEYDAIHTYSKDCEIFIDVGAWIGPITLFAAKLYNKVYSFEPDVIAFDELKTNVEINSFTNVELNKYAVSDKKGSIRLGGLGSTIGQSTTGVFGDADAFEIDCDSLRSVFETRKVPSYAFLKIDIEGGEYCLFDDGELFRSYTPVILLECHPEFIPPDKSEHFLNKLKSMTDCYDFHHMLDGRLSAMDMSTQSTVPRGHLLMIPKSTP